MSDHCTGLARRLPGGYGTGEGSFGLVEADDTSAPRAACVRDVPYNVAVASASDPNGPASERGADDRRWRNM